MTALTGGPSGPGTASSPSAAGPAIAPARAAGVELLGQHRGSGYRNPPALVRRRDGQVVQLTPLLYAVLDAIDGTRSEAAIADVVTDSVGRTVMADDVELLIREKLWPLGLLKLADGSEPPIRKVNPLLALRFRYVVADPARTRRITAPFAALFSPIVITLVTLAFAIVCYWVLFRKGLASAAHEAFTDPGMLLAVFAITVVSAGFHEFGHAAALRRGGGTPGAMGAGLYLVWPAFYTDVTDAYRLDRRARLRTDLGGLYFNAIAALVVFGAWALVRWDGLLLVVATQILQMIRQLPPLLRFDGYHILADVTGVPDLFHRIKPTLTRLWPSRRHSDDKFALKPWAQAVITVWVLLVVPLMLLTVLVTVLTLPRILASEAHSISTQWRLLGDQFHRGDWLAAAAKVLALVAVVLPAFGVVYLVYRSGRQLAARVLRLTAGRPIRRCAAAIVAAAVLGALLLAWWPRGNYRPINGTERGVLTQAFAPAALSGHPASAPIVTEGARRDVRTVWPANAPRPTAQHPQVAMVLTPRDPSQPTWVFPFNRPAPPGLGDNQALAVADKNGSAAYAVAFALVTATSDTVLNKNEAYAFASCTDCSAVAISFQVILIVGDAHVDAPQNISAAVSYNCIRCMTAALAIQLDVSIPTQPDAATMAKLLQLWSQIQTFGTQLAGLTLDQIRAQLVTYEQQILTIVKPYAQASATATSSPSPSAPTSTATGPSGTPTGTAPATPSGSGTAAPTTSATATSSGSSTPSETATTSAAATSTAATP
ncbi:MAG: hypothetical protein JO147_14495 [Actinobacteria bacterium]|nr:hypothetical protein [Actinomycetota bacterium]